MGETRVVKDLATGDRIQVKGFDDPLVVRSAKKVLKGTDAGKLDVKLVGPDGNIETVRFDPEQVLTVVGKDAHAGQTPPKPTGKGRGKAKPVGKTKGSADRPMTPKGRATRGKARVPQAPAEESTNAEVTPAQEGKAEPEATASPDVTATQAQASQTETTVAEAPQTGDGSPKSAPAEVASAEAALPVESGPTDTATPELTQEEARTKRTRGKKAQPDADGQPARLSALDTAAKVLRETGQSMNCQELIGAMAAKGYWTSPNGKTPAGTLYSAILRELQTKGNDARFVKAGRGRFARCGTPAASQGG
jgi:hypothetical protein